MTFQMYIRTVLLLFLTLLPLSPCAEVISPYEERDLELFGSSNNTHPGVLISRLDTTYTPYGHDRLIYHFKNPIIDTKILKNRQQQLQKLIENSELCNELTMLFNDLHEHQEGLLYLNTQGDPLAQHTIENFYFKNNILLAYNDRPWALDMHNYTKYLGLFGPVLEHVILHLALAHVQSMIMPHHHDHEHAHHHHDHFCINELESTHDASFITKSAFFLLKAGHLGLHVMSIKEMADQIGSERALINKIHCKVIHAHQCLTTIKKICAVLKKYHFNPEAFGQSYEILDFFEEQSSQKELIEFVNNIAFVQQPEIGFFSRIGPTLSYYRMLKNTSGNIQKLTSCMGDIDALLSVAQWCKKVPQESACFVEYIEAKKPMIHMHNVWHIVCDTPQAVKNTILLGNGLPNNMIITGPNKAGKSTILKAIGINIILAQSFGIAAAQEVKMTPCIKLITHMRIFDDIIKNASTMSAQIVRINSCMRTLHALEQGQFACILIDDSLFKGTSIQKEIELSESFVTDLGKNNRVCSIVATHLPILTELEEKQKNIFKNYCIDAFLNKQGKWISSFLLKPGIADRSRVFDIIESEKS